jgi:RNA polymerase sigma factor (sigma-70 family)
MSEPERRPVRPSEILMRPGASWTPDEREMVCAWLLEVPRYCQLLAKAKCCLGHQATPEDAEDAVSEFLLKKLNGIMDRFDPSRSTFLGFCFGCLPQSCSAFRLKAVRHCGPRLSLIRGDGDEEAACHDLLTDNRFDPYKSLEVKELAEAISRGLRDLSPGLAHVITLRIKGKSIADIAKELAITEDNAKVRLFRARRRLLAQLVSEGLHT